MSRRAGARTRTIARTAIRLAAGFLAGLLFWTAFSSAYEVVLAESAEGLARLTEWPAVTRLQARGGEILVERADFPPAAPRPGLPAADFHFNFVLLAALFAMAEKPWRGEWVARFLLAVVLLGLVHVTAVVFAVRSIYAARLGDWSAAHYGVVARNFWAGGFHFYQIAGRFAAPFAIWWLFAQVEAAPEPKTHRGRARSATGKRAARAVK